ncbi:hypothetical protein BZA05DRAFT_444641 [Tricharina praecox]|uniref:uncharacterized protein n=1 Tax=Tricharina praecox TaxID=43433 RepID=UPI00222105B2|nr:uncharacterized protein BZA05DRAFT_444641 [Tricharina praecox]KAI5852080.1 hypothetical protein BZA05DRAFT_444641 [Tricharina praecox]
MKFQHSFFAAQALFALLSAAPAAAQSVTLQEFADAFRQLGYTAFAEVILSSDEIQDRMTSGDDSYFTDLAVGVPEKNQAPPLDTSGGRRRQARSLAGSYQMSNPPRRARKRGYYEEEPDIPTGVRQSWLEDPSVVNLGCGIGQATVNKGSGQDVEVAVGLGKTVKSTGKVVKFKYGIIYEVESWFTIPLTFSDTACAVGAENFLDAAKEQGVVDTIDNTTSITIFAPKNPTKSCNVLDYVVADTVEYSPYLSARTYTAISGAKIVVTKDKDGSFRVNGDKIAQTDIMLKNGVMHTLDNKKTYKSYKEVLKVPTDVLKDLKDIHKSKRDEVPEYAVETPEYTTAAPTHPSYYPPADTTTDCETTTSTYETTTTDCETTSVYESTLVYEPETTPVYETTTPIYVPETTPVYEPETTPVYEATTPVYEPETTPVYEATTPVYEPETTPVYETTTPVYEPETTPVYVPETTPVYEPETTPVYEPSTPVYEPSTTVYEPTTAVYVPPVYETTPVYSVPVHNTTMTYATTPSSSTYAPSSTDTPTYTSNSTSPTFTSPPIESLPVGGGASTIRAHAALVAGAIAVLAFLM